MEVLFAVAGCLGAFALGVLACGRTGPRLREGGQKSPDVPPELARQWEEFLSYTGYPEGGSMHED